MSQQSRMARVILYNTTIQSQAGGITIKDNDNYTPVGSEISQYQPKPKSQPKPKPKPKPKTSIKKNKKSKKSKK